MSADFIDSNIFIYLFDETDAYKRSTAEEIVQRALETGTAGISFQVVQETLNILTGKLGATPDDARRFMDAVLVPLRHIMPSQPLYARTLELRSRYRFSFYDSLIVAAALEGGCTRLYSEDLGHGQRVEQLVIENPFRT